MKLGWWYFFSLISACGEKLYRHKRFVLVKNVYFFVVFWILFAGNTVNEFDDERAHGEQAGEGDWPGDGVGFGQSQRVAAVHAGVEGHEYAADDEHHDGGGEEGKGYAGVFLREFFHLSVSCCISVFWGKKGTAYIVHLSDKSC